MKKYSLILAILLLATNAFSQRYMTRTGKVTFFSATALENIEAVNNETACALDSKSGDVAFQVPVKSFKFEKALMQEHFNENYMESDKFPKADFKGKITNLNAVDFTKDGQYNVTAAGKMTMHGVTRDVSAPGTIAVKGGSIVAASKFKVRPSDYGIKIPGVVAGKIANEIEVTVNSIMAQK
jgi:polyisoprenoid-binding protein YceI